MNTTDAKRLEKIKDTTSFANWLVDYLETEDYEWLIEEAEKAKELEVEVKNLKEHVDSLEHEKQLLYGRLNNISDLLHKRIK